MKNRYTGFKQKQGRRYYKENILVYKYIKLIGIQRAFLGEFGIKNPYFLSSLRGLIVSITFYN